MYAFEHAHIYTNIWMCEFLSHLCSFDLIPISPFRLEIRNTDSRLSQVEDLTQHPQGNPALSTIFQSKIELKKLEIFCSCRTVIVEGTSALGKAKAFHFSEEKINISFLWKSVLFWFSLSFVLRKLHRIFQVSLMHLGHYSLVYLLSCSSSFPVRLFPVLDCKSVKFHWCTEKV